MKVLVYGLGRSGLAISRLLHQQGHTLLAYDANPKSSEITELKHLGATLINFVKHEDIDLCIAAPGVPFTHPDLVYLRQHAIETIGEVEWVYRSIQAKLIGITGTAGKTTVTRWLTDILALAGLPAKAGGNIDPALSAVAQTGDILVTELSSFQLERCPTLKPNMAIVTNLGVDHIDRHGSLEAYHQAKRAIIKNQSENDVFIYNLEDPVLCQWAKSSRAKTLSFSVRQPADAFLNGQDLIIHGYNLMSVKQLKQSGIHQVGNALAVALAAKVLNVSDAYIRQGLESFEGVLGRYTIIASKQGITFIEDSIATRTLAVKVALEATPRPIVWIAGGVDKGASLTELEPLVKEKVSLLLGTGQDGALFAKHFENITMTAYSPLKDGRAALEWACLEGQKHLQRFHQGQGTILLAPLAASFDQFKDYKERATIFRQVVESLLVNHG